MSAFGAMLCALVGLVPTEGYGGEIVVRHAYRAGEAEALVNTIDQFRQAHSEAMVQMLAVPGGAYAQKLRSKIPHGHGPDHFVTPHDKLDDLSARGLIEPMPPTDFDRLLPETLAPLLTPEPGLWAWPMAYKRRLTRRFAESTL